ncbi:MAG TPA: ATP-binding protein [Verrucomicrobiae bacterium]
MNTRSLRFQLFTWYAALLLGSFALVGVATYIALERSLTGALEQTQVRRARQIGHLLQEELRAGDEGFPGRVRKEIEASLAPSQNNRFIRITRGDGLELYRSGAPADHSFEPASLPTPQWPARADGTRPLVITEGRDLLLTGARVELANGTSYLVETGAPLTEVRVDLKKWVIFLGSVLPLLGAIALLGGFVLVNRALSPVDHITESAAHISSHNLSERLPVARTGDELERLSIALNRMIERLDAAFKHSRRFVADASHELRTPLTVLRGELEGLVAEPQMSADWRERLGSVLEEVDRLTGIVEGLFAISRLDAGEAAAEWAKFDLAQLAVSTADQMSLLAEDKQIRVTCAAAKGVWVEGDRARLKQVVVNLLDNAIKYTPAGGAITLTVRADDGRALLEVGDTGIGIPGEFLPRVFERFFRVDRARSRDEGGAGLGLSIVESICAAHQGRVEVHSVPGEGSLFRVALPLIAEPMNNQNKQMSYAY